MGLPVTRPWGQPATCRSGSQHPGGRGSGAEQRQRASDGRQGRRGRQTQPRTQFLSLLLAPASLTAKTLSSCCRALKSPCRAWSPGTPPLTLPVPVPPRSPTLELSPPEANSLECPQEPGLQGAFGLPLEQQPSSGTRTRCPWSPLV